jgi:hypothetical protein
MSVYDLYQSYINQMQNPVVQEGNIDPNYLLYLQQQQQMQGQGGNDNQGIMNINNNLAVGQKPPSALMTGLMSLIAPPVGIAMGMQRFADQGKLPFGLNNLFGSRDSGNVEGGLSGLGGSYSGTAAQQESLMSEMSQDYGGSNSGSSGAAGTGNSNASEPGGSDEMGSF